MLAALFVDGILFFDVVRSYGMLILVSLHFVWFGALALQVCVAVWVCVCVCVPVETCT